MLQKYYIIFNIIVFLGFLSILAPYLFVQRQVFYTFGPRLFEVSIILSTLAIRIPMRNQLPAIATSKAAAILTETYEYIQL